MLSPLIDLVLHDHAFARAAHGTPSRRLDSLVALALRTVFGVVGEVVCPAGAIVAIAARISSRDLMLAAIFDDVACAHIATRLSAPRRKPSMRGSSGSFADQMMKRAKGGTLKTNNAFFFFVAKSSEKANPVHGRYLILNEREVYTDMTRITTRVC